GYRNLKRIGMNMIFVVTPLYALPVAAIYLALWMRVSAMRAATGVSFGDGGNAALLQRIRQHGNCAEWMSFVLILMMLAEGLGAPAIWLHVSGVLLLIGRIAHPFGLKADTAGHPLRYVGNGSNILAALTAMVYISIHIIGQ
ncbi:MAPEG family protein, partial [Ahrensia kielensis]